MNENQKEKQKEILEIIENNKEIKLGLCPYCDSNNYSRSVEDYQQDYIVMDCCCNECNESWTEYSSLDEVKFYKENEEYIYNNSLSETEKETLIKAMILLKKTEKIEIPYYTRIIRILKGKLIKNE